MSADPEYIRAIENGRIAGACVFAAATVVLYDILLTFSREVSCIWQRQWNLVTVVFAVCRYGTLIDLMLRVIGSFYVPDTIWVSAQCKASAYSNYTFDVLVLFSIAAFACLRVWAICGQKWLPLIPVFLLTIYPPCYNIYNYSTPSEFVIINEGFFSGCNVIPLRDQYIYSGVITRCIASAGDALVLGLTWYKTIDVVKESRRLHMKTGLSTIFIKNGSSQFLILLLLNVTNAVLNVLNVAITTPAASFFFYINFAVSSMLVSRFLLDLRSVYLSDQGHDSFNPPSSVRFAQSMIGNMGAPLETFVALNAGDEHELYDRQPVYSNDPFSVLMEMDPIGDSNESTVMPDTPVQADTPGSHSHTEPLSAISDIEVQHGN